MSNTTYRAEHAGLTRVIDGANRVSDSIHQGVSQKRVYRSLTAIAILVAVTFAGRRLETSTLSFWAEALALAVVAFAAFALMISIIVPLLRFVVRVIDHVSAKVQQSRADELFWQSAQHDPRIMAELDAARARQGLQVEESQRAPAWTQLTRYW